MMQDHSPILLSLPTFDGNPSVTHPDVVYVESGIHGWKYWMAYTPYPDDPRENPHVAVSNDGVTWQTPEGGSVPAVPFSEVTEAGNNYNSDTDLVLLQDGITLRMHYRLAGGGLERLRFRESSDGITWGNFVEFLTAPGSPSRLLSPAIIIEPDGSWVMWTVNNNHNPRRIERRTSSDGIAWNEPTTAVIPAWHANTQPWHVDIIRGTRGRYYMLLNTRSGSSNNPHRMTWLESDDGLTWSGPEDYVIPTGQSDPPSPYAFESWWHYRGCLLLTDSYPPRFDVWYTGIDNSNRLSGTWRIALLRNWLSPAWDWSAVKTHRVSGVTWEPWVRWHPVRRIAEGAWQ